MIVPLAVASRGFIVPSGSIDTLAVASRGFILSVLVGFVEDAFLDLEIIGTPADALASVAVMADTPMPARGVMADMLDSRNILREDAYALGDIADTPLAALGMIRDSFSVEDIVDDPDVSAEGEISDIPVPALGAMTDVLAGKDIVDEDPVDAEGEMADEPIDVKGEMA